MKTRILLIEDNPQNRNLVTFLLEHRGYDVIHAETGPRGLELAAQVDPALILLDIQLPGMDGYAVARHVRDALKGDIFLVALTGYGQPRDREMAVQAGFDVHMRKPVDIERLRELVAGRHVPAAGE